MRPNLKGALALAVAALVTLASGAAGATTAGEVVDDETLKAFVDGAAADIAAITDINEGARLRERLRTEGEWKSGSMFLIIFLKSGEPFIHGNDRAAESKNLLGVEDDHGTRVVEELLAAADRGGGFVKYHDGEPKTAYAVEYTSGITARQFVLVGGYSQDVSHVPVQIADLPKPAVTASQVVDRETLITFVEEAARVYREAVLSEGYSALTGIRNAFREEGGDWKSGSIYLWVVSAGGVTLFHATEPFREGTPTNMERTDVNGVRFAEELIGGARREGRKFLRYHYDDPTIEGDEDTGSPKLGYAVGFAVPNSDQKAVIGSGIYLGMNDARSSTDTISKAWLARFGRTVTDQVVDAVKGRLEAPRRAGASVTLVGQALPSWMSGDGAAPGAASDDGQPGPASFAETRDAAWAMRRWMTFARPEEGNSAAGFGVSGDPRSGPGQTPGSRIGVRGGWRSGANGGSGFESRALTQRDFVTGTSFALSAQAGGPGGGFASVWGRGAFSAFDGREGDLSLDGAVTTGLIGADWASAPGSDSRAGRWTAGLAIGHSTGSGDYRSDNCTSGNCGGEVESTLTGLYPYAGLSLSERLSVWAAAGHGAGEVTVSPDGSAALSADLTMSMGAAGMRSEVLRPADGDGLVLAVKGDARFTRTSSKAVRSADGNLQAAEAGVRRARAGIEGSRRFSLSGSRPGVGEGGASVTPSFEIGVRLDGGDAETGFGADLGGGLAFADPANGLWLDLKGRGLVAHRASGFREWGASASLGWDPRPATDRGLSLSLTRSWGAAPSGGMDALLTRETLAGLAANDNGGGGFRAAGRLEGEIGYGIALFGGGFTGTPNLGFGLSDSGTRDWRVGWRLTSAVPRDPGFEVSFDATRKGPANDAAPEYGVLLKGTLRW